MNKSAQSVSSGNGHESDFIAVALGMLWQNRLPAASAMLILWLPSCTAMATSEPPGLSARIIERLLEVIVLMVLGRHAVKKLSASTSTFSVRSAVSIIVLGFAFWFGLFLPLVVAGLSIPAALKFMGFMLCIPLFVFMYLYFFYFFPFFIGIGGIRNALATARTFVRQDRLLPLRVLLGPTAMTQLVLAIISSASPDGRYGWQVMASSFTSSVFFVLCCYLGYGAGVVFLSEAAWRTAGLDPYRQSRLATLELQGHGRFTRLFHLSGAIKIIVVALLLETANLARLSSLPPAVRSSILSFELREHAIVLTLNIEDTRYGFRGFRPIFFRIAGAQRYYVSSSAEYAYLDGKQQDVRLGLPVANGTHRLEMKFTTTLSAEDLKQKEDLFIWYGAVRLLPLNLKHSPQTPPSRPAAE